MNDERYSDGKFCQRSESFDAGKLVDGITTKKQLFELLLRFALLASKGLHHNSITDQFTMLTSSCIRRLAVRGSRGAASVGYVRQILGGGAAAATTNNDLPTIVSPVASTVHQRMFCSKSGDKDSAASIDHLFKSNKQWVDETNETDKDFFTELGKGQSPDYLYIGCADSRVSISKLTGLDLGEVFVHRNIANMVVSNDLNLLAVLTYAVNHLKVKHILVTGHYDCGGVRASVKNQDLGQVLDAWLQNIRDVSRLHRTELDSIEDDETRHRRLVELNVKEQCLNLYKNPVVQKRRLETFKDPESPHTYPKIHGLVFDPATGILEKIPIDFKSELAELNKTYSLFDGLTGKEHP